MFKEPSIPRFLYLELVDRTSDVAPRVLPRRANVPRYVENTKLAGLLTRLAVLHPSQSLLCNIGERQ